MSASRPRAGAAAGHPLRHALPLATALAIGAAAAAAAFTETRGYALLGWDSYPILAGSRVGSPSDLWRIASTELMQGRYPGGAFYRPLLCLSFAAEHALFGLDPAGYQLTNALAFGALLAVFYALARHAAGPHSGVAAPAATLLLALHPSWVEVVPVPARRPELLCGLFLSLGLLSQLRPRALLARRPPIAGPAAAGALAFASKEVGVAAPGLAFVAVLLYSPRAGAGARLRHAAVAAVPSALGVGMVLAARVAALGGIGGHRSMSAWEIAAHAPLQLAAFARTLVLPPQVAGAVAPALAAALAIGLGLAFLAARGGDGAAAAGFRSGRCLVLGLAWLLLLGSSYAPSGRFEPWYVPLVGTGYALAVGAIVEALRRRAGRGAGARRAAAVLALVLVTALVATPASFSPLVHRYDGWRRASRASDAFLRRLGERIAAAPDGARVSAPPLPMRLSRRRDRPSVQGGAVLAAYSVRAWAELAFPERRVRVLPPGVNPPPVRVEEVQVVVASLRPL